MADVPEDLLQQIEYLERLFIVDQTKLKQITDHFVKELTKGIMPAALILFQTRAE